jgi:hypothetical protein
MSLDQVFREAETFKGADDVVSFAYLRLHALNVKCW